jgi:uncharacterized protein (DUF1778 family)
MSLADERGGAAQLSESQRALIRQAAALSVRSEGTQAALLRGEAVDGEELVRVTNALSRTLAALDRGRAPRQKAGPGALADYLAGKAAAP